MAAARPLRHNQDLSSKEKGLFDRVRDEEDPLCRRVPDGDQEFLHLLARQTIEGTERFIHQKDVGFGSEGARNATRWRMPPDNS